jgi:hypothetical protein
MPELRVHVRSQYEPAAAPALCPPQCAGPQAHVSHTPIRLSGALSSALASARSVVLLCGGLAEVCEGVRGAHRCQCCAAGG